MSPETVVKPDENVELKRGAVPEGGTEQAPGNARGIYDVKDKNYQGEMCGTKPIRHTGGNGPGIITQSVSESKTVQWEANVGVDADTVSAGMGWSVSKTYTIREDKSVDVPKNKYGNIMSYVLYQSYTFKVYSAIGDYVGKGSVLKPHGVCFSTYFS